MAVAAFFDTSVLLAGLVDFGPQSAPAQAVLHAIAEKQVANPGTAWHCCLEFFSVATRLPAEFRVTPQDAAMLLQEEIFSRIAVHDLPPPEFAWMRSRVSTSDEMSHSNFPPPVSCPMIIVFFRL